MSINRVILIGNLTRDPESRELPSGTTVCHLRVACNRVRRDEDGGWVERPNFFDVSVFGPQAESAQQYLHKGRPVGIDGRLEWREWETPDQQRRQAVNIVAETVQFLGRPSPSSAEPAGDEAGEAAAGERAPTDAEPAQDAESAAEVDEALIF